MLKHLDQVDAHNALPLAQQAAPARIRGRIRAIIREVTRTRQEHGQKCSCSLCKDGGKPELLMLLKLAFRNC